MQTRCLPCWLLYQKISAEASLTAGSLSAKAVCVSYAAVAATGSHHSLPSRVFSSALQELQMQAWQQSPQVRVKLFELRLQVQHFEHLYRTVHEAMRHLRTWVTRSHQAPRESGVAASGNLNVKSESASRGSWYYHRALLEVLLIRRRWRRAAIAAQNSTADARDPAVRAVTAPRAPEKP